MAISVEKILTDTHSLIVRLKKHDSSANDIIASTQALFLKVEATKQYQEDIVELNELAKHRPRSTLVLGIAQENRQIRQLQQEKRELQATLEDHQAALELIMHKYREHTVKLLHSSRMEKAIQDKQLTQKDSMCHLMDKIDEMAGVMQKAIEVDETTSCADKERLSQLEAENRTLRELLEICGTSQERILPQEVPPEVKTEEDTTKKEVKEEEGEDSVNEVEEEDQGDSSDSNSTVASPPSTPSIGKKEASGDSGDKKSSTPSSGAVPKKSPERTLTKDTVKGKTPTTTAGKRPVKAATPAVKKTTSAGANVAKRDSPAVRKSPSTDTKKTATKGSGVKSAGSNKK